jgi:dUTP pyrophosphatase
MLTTLPVLITLAPDAKAPRYASDGAAGADLHAAVPAAITLAPGERHLVPTGVSIALPDGVEAQVRPRSGLAVKHGLTVLNAPGTIDWDYRGEIKVPLINLGEAPVEIEPGMRIAQLVLAPVLRADWQVAKSLDDTARGAGGFGSTGVDG